MLEELFFEPLTPGVLPATFGEVSAGHLAVIDGDNLGVMHPDGQGELGDARSACAGHRIGREGGTVTMGTRDLGARRDAAATIKKAALSLFSDVGYEAASMRQIAAAVGNQPASLYNHYPSKEEILWAICEEAMLTLITRGQEAAASSPDPVEQLRAFVRQHIRFHIDHREEARVINQQMTRLGRERYRQVTAMRDDYERSLRRILRRGARRGRFHVPDYRMASYAILAIGMHVSVWYRPDGPSPASAVVRHHEQLALQLAGTR
ncbi:MAG: TetR family transcriptional regulator [Propionibacteriales bacterium]|nr:TetR family transcriptional regulator [Propionibacteriales bacterium]